MSENQDSKITESKPTPQPTPSNGSGLEENIASCLCYVLCWISGLIFYLLEKDNKAVKFHALQAMIMSVTLIAYSFASWILIQIPFVGFIIELINMFIYLGSFALFVVCAVRAYQGTKFVIPIVSDLAEKYAEKDLF